MLTEADIRRCAMLSIERHGSEAPKRAAERAAELAAKGDRGGHDTWRKIAGAIERLQAQSPPIDIC